MNNKRLIEEAMRLPPEARAALAGELLESLDGETVDAGREAAWASEIRNRLDAWERGEDKAVTEDEFLAQLDETALT